MTVTLYHRGGVGWERQILTGVWAGWCHGGGHTGSIPRDDRGQSTILIPGYEGLRLGLGDGICPGEGPELENAPLKAQLPQGQLLREITRYACGSGLDHWEVKAE